MNFPVRIQLLLLSILLLALPVQADELAFHDAWVAAAPATAKTQAAYICFVNNGDKDVEITAVNAKGFGSAMIHTTMQHGEMTMMHPLMSLLVPAHQMVTLQPGSTHIMLMDPVKVARPGETVAITVHYKDGSDQVFELEVKTPDQVQVKPAKGPAPDHDHQPALDKH